MSAILVAEDDPAILEGLVVSLESDGHAVRAARDGAEALALAAESRPDLALLDVMMPKKSGWDVCAELRRRDPALPIVILTARGAESDKLLGFGLGADDYVVKPFGVRELLARVRAALRRAAAQAPAGAGPEDGFDFAGARVLAAAHALRAPDGTESPLTPRELALLRLFAARPGQVLDRDRLLNAVWGVGYYGTTRTLDQHVANLRRKLGAAAPALETLRGAGYRYRPAP